MHESNPELRLHNTETPTTVCVCGGAFVGKHLKFTSKEMEHQMTFINEHRPFVFLRSYSLPKMVLPDIINIRTDGSLLGTHSDN